MLGIDEIKALLRELQGSDVAELHLESGDFKLTLKKALATLPLAALEAARVPASVAPQPTAGAAVPEAAAAKAPASRALTIPAPMVGTFYRSPSPDAPPFLEVGDTVRPGQTVCIIEAMKLMNELEAEVGGRVARIMVDNGQAVEYGQALFELEPL